VDTVRHEFCDWYIEIAKVKNSPVTDKVMLYALGTFYKVLHPSLPFATEKLWELVGFKGPLMISEWPQPLAIGDKNYRINMLMEMIAHRRQLKTQVTDKPHEKISIFVQGNKDIQLLVEQHYELVRDIIKVEKISYFEEHQEIEDERQIAMLMDIKLGAKGIKSVDRRVTLQDLEKQIAEEEQFLQRMRGMFTGDFAARAPESVIKEKKKKMEEVKSRIAAMQYEINKIKMERK
jgi:valyl-tRNA synthetase